MALGGILNLAPAAANPNELGHPIFRDFPPGRSNIAHLCQAVVQDAAGFMYVANGANLRFYDGQIWRVIRLPTAGAGIRKFSLTSDGKIFAGGAGVIGWIRPVGPGRQFVSLADQLPPADHADGDVLDVLAVGETVYFSTERRILIWRNNQFASLAYPTPPHSRGARFFRVDETVYVSALTHPLGRMAGDRVEAVADDPVLRDNEIMLVEAAGPTALRLLTARRGFFNLAQGRLAPAETATNPWLAGRQIICAQRLADGSLAVAFSAPSGDGGMRFDAGGNYVGPIDQSLGLYVKTVRALCPDREGGLWLGTETGLFRLEWPSAFTQFDSNNGLGLGTVAEVVRHGGVLYAATTEGVYRLNRSGEDGRVARFERIFDRPVYALLSRPAGLLALGYADLLELSASGFVPVAKVPPGGGRLRPVPDDPAAVWADTAGGGRIFRLTAAGWFEAGPPGVPAAPPATSAEVVWATSEAGDTRGPDGGHWVMRATSIERGAAPGAEPRVLPQLVAATVGHVTCLREESGPEGAVLWVGGRGGLVRVETTRAFPPRGPFTLQLFGRGVRRGDRLPSNPPAIAFDFVALRHQIANEVTYQTRLAGYEDWSPWAAGRTRVYPHLPAGEYRFEVRARDADAQPSAPAAFGFAVQAPWWLTSWAFLGFIGAGGGLVSGVVRFRTRTLRRRAERLEALVAERTAELARQNVELVRLNRLELDAKITARLAEEKARLEVLRYQLNPHFLFNTLASISGSLPAGAAVARAMVERLAEFCRLTLYRADGRDWTTLGGEMKLLRAYLQIEQSRWGELLDVEIAVDEALAAELLPHFLLLPLLENALKYGRATSTDRVGIRLAARREVNGPLVLEVANTGTWVEPGKSRAVSSLGIGLENLRDRLAHHYPNGHRLEIAHAGGWVTATLCLMKPPLP
ncbi:MAG: histidine kinase [Opitutales bacterium]